MSWKENVTTPNNYVMPAARLNYLINNLVKRGLTTRYNEEVKLLDEGYAEKVFEQVKSI